MFGWSDAEESNGRERWVKEGQYWCTLSSVCTQMGKLLAITDKQSCSVTAASSVTYHYPGEFIIRHRGEKKIESISQPH